jgi:hypothetical protein
MHLKVFLECLETIWVLYFAKTLKISGLIAFGQSFDKSCALHFWLEGSTFAELITKKKNSNQFGISAKVSSMHLVYGKITPGAFARD